MSLTRIRSSSSNLVSIKEDSSMLKTMTIYDKKTNNVLAKTTGDEAHLDRFGKQLHKELEGRTDFRVHIEDAPLLGFDFSEITKQVSKITPDRVLIGINLLISIALVIKLFS